MIQLYQSLGYSRRNVSQITIKASANPLFISALFTIAKLWKQPKYPTTDECISKM
jgi:hypothetical protein